MTQPQDQKYWFMDGLDTVFHHSTIRTRSIAIRNNDLLSRRDRPWSFVLLAFAWTEMRDTPVILGHMNFFSEFNVCFYRHELAFEVCPKDE
jgi:hypothetical protein